MSEPSSNKRNYTILLSIVFVGIGSWKLYDKFVQDKEVESYQWILAAGLVVFGAYQLIGLKKK
ncbi:MAG: hypothetical protein QMB11_07190 [Nonlabens sp.]|jgi:hypothetical protein|uniref:hypothetical protein n=1 Tax=Nonlabens sp. TaxID=1888209 RepID=UPI0035A6BD33